MIFFKFLSHPLFFSADNVSLDPIFYHLVLNARKAFCVSRPEGLRWALRRKLVFLPAAFASYAVDVDFRTKGVHPLSRRHR
jgi:hypothetical protein